MRGLPGIQALCGALKRPIRLVDWFVFGPVFLVVFAMVLLRALPLPRIYQSSVMVAVSAKAKEQGWDELRASDLPSWLPIITPRVARHFDTRIDGAAFLKPYGLGEKDQSLEITKLISRDLKAVYDEKNRTTTLYFRHPDFKVAGEVVSWVGQEYISYLQRDEVKAMKSLNKMMDNMMRIGEVQKKKAETQRERVEAAMLALDAFRKSHNGYSEKSGQLESDEQQHQNLVEAVRAAEAEYKVLLNQLRDSSMLSGPQPSPVQVVSYSGWAASHYYLLTPLIVRAAWGCLAAVVCAVMMVIVTRSMLLLVAGRP